MGAGSQIAWMKDAACRDMDTDLFFNTYSTTSVNVHPLVRETCGKCPVTTECYTYAEQNHLDYGVFGGLSSSQRESSRAKTGRTSANFRKIV